MLPIRLVTVRVHYSSELFGKLSRGGRIRTCFWCYTTKAIRLIILLHQTFISPLDPTLVQSRRLSRRRSTPIMPHCRRGQRNDQAAACSGAFICTTLPVVGYTVLLIPYSANRFHFTPNGRESHPAVSQPEL